ncbi:glucan biosynthesis protein [Shigella flexneri]
MEIPTTGETLDNIVCFWQPEKAVKAGDEFAFQYRLYWKRDACSLPISARYGDAYRNGFSRKVGRQVNTIPKNGRVVAVDFVGRHLKAAERQKALSR